MIKIFQTRNYQGEILLHETMKEALHHATIDEFVWKISFPVGLERIRLVRTNDGWLYENIIPGDIG